jgi:Flp pilus assembly protein TadD
MTNPWSDGAAEALVRTGEQLEERGDLAGAEQAYRRADAAGSAEGASHLGCLLFERGDIEAARAALVRADERGSGMGVFRLGFLLQQTGEIAEAEQAYRRGVKRGNPQAAHNLVVMLRRRGDHAGAAEVEQSTAPAGGSAEALLAEARRSGIPTFRVDDPEALSIALAKRWYEEGKIELAEESFRKIATHGRQARGLAALNLGILLEQRGDLAGARQAYETAIASDDRSAAGGAGLNLGLISGAQGDLAEAERACSGSRPSRLTPKPGSPAR